MEMVDAADQLEHGQGLYTNLDVHLSTYRSFTIIWHRIHSWRWQTQTDTMFFHTCVVTTEALAATTRGMEELVSYLPQVFNKVTNSLNVYVDVLESGNTDDI